ncbi:MAG: glycosyltransferase family 39 protein, partial [Burkholderiales bacterium]|nr:glycosyltransferase family 39 protein [Anaerolineae bacterium]
MKRRWRRDCVTALVLLLCLWATRLAGLEALPLHNDEGLHLTRAVEVWNLHPFWDISDGKIINHWPIAAFYPQNAPVFVSRVPTIMVAMIGLAAGYALARRLFGNIAALFAGVMWITSPYLFFFERLAFSDAQAGALVVLTLWACWRLWDYPSARHAIFTGLALGVAILFKFTAAPFALLVVVVIAFANRIAWRRRLLYLVLAGLATLASFIVPLLYITLRGRGFFEVALNWVGGGSSGSDGTSFLAENIARLVAQLTDFGPPLWSLALVIGLVALAIWGGRRGRVSLLAWGLPLMAITVLGSEVLPRHYVVALPLALVAAGMGIGVGLDYISVGARHVGPLQAGYLVALLGIVLVVGFVPFALTAFS